MIESKPLHERRYIRGDLSRVLECKDQTSRTVVGSSEQRSASRRQSNDERHASTVVTLRKRILAHEIEPTATRSRSIEDREGDADLTFIKT